MYQEAVKYREKYGNLNIPDIYISDSGMLLGRWIRNLHEQYRKKDPELTAEQIILLENIGMVWKKRKLLDWEGYYTLAEEYYVQHGNLNVTPSYITRDRVCLGRWVYRNRLEYRRRKGELSEERVRRLEDIGMKW